MEGRGVLWLSFISPGKFQDINKLRRLVTDLSQRRPGYDYRPDRAGFVVETMVLAQVFLQVLRALLVSFIPPFIFHRHYIILAIYRVAEKHTS
jgi:hypothetical protein